MLASREGLGLGRRDARVGVEVRERKLISIGVEVVDDRPFDVLVRFLALVCFAAVGREVPAYRTSSSLLSSV